MIKIENVDVCGFEPSIRGMRNPKNSWAKSDSGKKPLICTNGFVYCVGDNDLSLMNTLASGGAVHAKYRRFIDVYVDIDAPLYFWKEFKTYRKSKDFVDEEDFYSYDGDHVIEDFIEMNSCSTMHKIHAKEFTLDDFSHDHMCEASMVILEETINMLNYFRSMFIDTQEKTWWWQLVQLLPSSYNQRRTVKLNYEVLGAMYHWRKNHKLDEWREFCRWIESLPYSEVITNKSETK